MTHMPNLFTEATVTGSPVHTMDPTTAEQRTQRTALVRWVTLGALSGLTWGAALRALMVVLALQFGERPQFTWHGTYVVILLPSALMGALLGAAAHLTGSTGEKRWRWAILSPLLLVLFPLLFLDDFVPALITTGIGGGAIYVALMGVLGGYAFSAGGRGWMRWGLGILNVSLLIAAIVVGNGTASLPDAEHVFSMLYFGSLLALLIAGVSAPSYLGVGDVAQLNGGNHGKQ